MIALLRHRVQGQDERGVTLVFVALFMVALAGMVAFSVDIGNLALSRRRAQNGVDAAALAGVQMLPDDKTNATKAARAWAANNGVSSSEIVSVSFSKTHVTDDTVTVTARRQVNFAFAKLLGVASSGTTVTAKAIVGSVNGGIGIMPFGLLDLNGLSTPGFGYNFGQTVTLEEPPGNHLGPGNYGLLALDGKGGSTIRDTIAQGGSKTFYRVGDETYTEPGQKSGPITQGLDAWAESNGDDMDSDCSDWDKSHKYVDGKLQITPKCRYRVVLIPIIDEWPNGRKLVTILGFVQVYLEGRGTGHKNPLDAIFLDEAIGHPGSELGPLNSYGTHIVRLTD
jgi:Flp pilus assembly protein TadG